MLKFQLEALFVRLEPGDFLTAKLRQFGIGGLGLDQGAVGREVFEGLEIGGAVIDEGLQARVFAGEILVSGVVGEHFGIAQFHFDLGEPAGEFLDEGTEIHG
jgi:hypothetical protein